MNKGKWCILALLAVSVPIPALGQASAAMKPTLAEIVRQMNALDDQNPRQSVLFDEALALMDPGSAPGGKVVQEVVSRASAATTLHRMAPAKLKEFLERAERMYSEDPEVRAGILRVVSIGWEDVPDTARRLKTLQDAEALLPAARVQLARSDLGIHCDMGPAYVMWGLTPEQNAEVLKKELQSYRDVLDSQWQAYPLFIMQDEVLRELYIQAATYVVVHTPLTDLPKLHIWPFARDEIIREYPAFARYLTDPVFGSYYADLGEGVKGILMSLPANSPLRPHYLAVMEHIATLMNAPAGIVPGQPVGPGH